MYKSNSNLEVSMSTTGLDNITNDTTYRKNVSLGGIYRLLTISVIKAFKNKNVKTAKT